MTPLVMVALLVMTAGCGGVIGGDTNTVTPTELQQPSSEGGEQRQPSPTPTATPAAQLTFSTATETNEIILTPTDTPDGYAVTGQVYRMRASATGSVKTQMKKHGIILNHERSFEYQVDDNKQPDLLLASISIFDSTTAAAAYEQSFVGNLNMTSSKSFEIGSDTTAKTIRFVNQEGDKNTLVITTVDNAMFYVVTSDRDRFYPRVSKAMFSLMLSRAQESTRDT